MKRIFAALVAATAALALSGCVPDPKGTTRPSGNAISIYVDGETGCQYVKAENISGGLSPRLDSFGRPMCGMTGLAPR